MLRGKRPGLLIGALFLTFGGCVTTQGEIWPTLSLLPTKPPQDAAVQSELQAFQPPSYDLCLRARVCEATVFRRGPFFRPQTAFAPWAYCPVLFEEVIYEYMGRFECSDLAAFMGSAPVRSVPEINGVPQSPSK